MRIIIRSSQCPMQAKHLDVILLRKNGSPRRVPWHPQSFLMLFSATLQLTLPHRTIANLSLGLVSQDLPQDLSRRVLRNGFDELDTARQPLVLGHPRRQPLGDVPLCCTLAVLLQCDVSARQLFAVDGDAHDGGVLHGWVIEEEGFELGRGDLVALDFDEFLGCSILALIQYSQQHSQYTFRRSMM